jgi:hypothetical protein
LRGLDSKNRQVWQDSFGLSSMSPLLSSNAGCEMNSFSKFRGRRLATQFSLRPRTYCPCSVRAAHQRVASWCASRAVQLRTEDLRACIMLRAQCRARLRWEQSHLAGLFQAVTCMLARQYGRAKASVAQLSAFVAGRKRSIGTMETLHVAFSSTATLLRSVTRA